MDFDAWALARRATAVPWYTRRLSDKILLAFHHACDVGECEAAAELLRCYEMASRRSAPPDRDHRRAIEMLASGDRSPPGAPTEWPKA